MQDADEQFGAGTNYTTSPNYLFVGRASQLYPFRSSSGVYQIPDDPTVGSHCPPLLALSQLDAPAKTALLLEVSENAAGTSDPAFLGTLSPT